jgi:predicted GIY-YIG superfamily endonuclease
MNVNELIPKPAFKVQLKLSYYIFIPKEAGCYILTTFDNDIIYVGASDNLFYRFQQHLNNAEKTNLNNNGKAIWFYYKICDSKNLPMLERAWINQFVMNHGKSPALNKINSPVNKYFRVTDT